MIYALGDLHLDHTQQKKMDIFGPCWTNYEEKIFRNWRSVVQEEDLVLLPGDISWAMNLEGALGDLRRIDELPGRKILGKGNHDYWWSGMKKMRALDLKTISFLHNNCYEEGDFLIIGTRGWGMEEAGTPEWSKMITRELRRLTLSLEAYKGPEKRIIAMLHYPPFDENGVCNAFGEWLENSGIWSCVYGHLHAEGHLQVREGLIGTVNYFCVASDFVNFFPVKITNEGRKEE